MTVATITRTVCRVCGKPTSAGPFGAVCAACLLRPVTATARPRDVSGEATGDKIGRYTLLEVIGEGGFGIVWKAEQLEPVRREVALKILKPGMDTREVITRFEIERQTLAMMDHPCIAHVYDAGATAAGRPYFVMELVNGAPITEHCEQNKLPLRERLELFMTVCGAIQHAHQKGIIHRDLKPSNILVTRDRDAPTPKIIDFGIAKALAANGLGRATLSLTPQVLGTPAYMSPEQVDAVVDVDTRSDIYSLGVLLYEMLAGRPPFEAKTLAEAGWEEMRRIIREVEPRKPSTLLLHPESDLDWIVMKCLEKERERRYETAGGLALDIQRHLDHAPVLARPPSRWYVLQKVARRNRVAFIAAALVLLSLVAGIVTSTLQMKRAQRAERVAVRNLRDAESARSATRAVNDFLVSALGSPQPGRDGLQITVAETLERASARADADLASAPESHLGVLKALAQTNQSLGLSQRAAELASKLTVIARKTFADDPVKLAAWLDDAAGLLQDAGRGKEALSCAEAALALPLTDKERRYSLNRLATESAMLLDVADAERRARQMVREAQAGFGNASEQALKARALLATVLQRRGANADAAEEARAVMEEARRAGLRSAYAKAVFRLADLLRQSGDKAVLPMLEEAHAWLQQQAGSADETAISVSAKLAESLQLESRLADAVRVKRDILMALRQGKADIVRELGAAMDLADLVIQTGDCTEARRLYEEARPRCTAHFGARHPLTLRVQRGLALCLIHSSQREEGVKLLGSAIAEGKADGVDGGSIMNLLHALAAERFAAGALAESLPLYQERLHVAEQTFGKGSLNTLLAQRDVGDILTRLHRTKESLPLLQDAVTKISRLVSAPDPALVLARDLLVKALFDAGDASGALKLRENVLLEARQKLPADHAFVSRSRGDLAAAINDAKKLAETSKAEDAGRVADECERLQKFIVNEDGKNSVTPPGR